MRMLLLVTLLRRRVIAIWFYLLDKFRFKILGKAKDGNDILADLEKYPSLTKHFGPK